MNKQASIYMINIVNNQIRDTNHLTDPKNNGDQDNRCLFRKCYRGTTLYKWTQCFSKPVADGDMRGWHYNGGINMEANPFLTISGR